MSLIEFYDMIGGDYKGVMNRLMKEARIKIYLKQFEADDTLTSFCEQLNAGNYEEAFREVHNIKGLALNLGLKPLAESSSVLCEALRRGKPETDIADMVEKLRTVYEQIAENIILLN